MWVFMYDIHCFVWLKKTDISQQILAEFSKIKHYKNLCSIVWLLLCLKDERSRFVK